jgi:hypothetical protein
MIRAERSGDELPEFAAIQIEVELTGETYTVHRKSL